MRGQYPFPWTREALSAYVLSILEGERMVSEASATIKREREGRVDPAWEGTTADQHEEEHAMIQALIADVRGAIA